MLITHFSNPQFSNLLPQISSAFTVNMLSLNDVKDIHVSVQDPDQTRLNSKAVWKKQGYKEEKRTSRRRGHMKVPRYESKDRT